MVLRKKKKKTEVLRGDLFDYFFPFLWDISIQPSCSMLRRHWSKWTNLLEIKKKLPFLSLSIYIILIQFIFREKKNLRQSVLSQTPEENFLFFVFLFSFLYKLLCVVPIRIRFTLLFSPWSTIRAINGILSFFKKYKQKRNNVGRHSEKNIHFWDHLISCYVR